MMCKAFRNGLLLTFQWPILLWINKDNRRTFALQFRRRPQFHFFSFVLEMLEKAMLELCLIISELFCKITPLSLKPCSAICY